MLECLTVFLALAHVQPSALPTAHAIAPLAVLMDVFGTFMNYALFFIGFSIVILFHELGHFLAAKACKVRVHKLALGFGKEIVGFTRGETRYSINVLPLGGYVKMLGQSDFDDKSEELRFKDDPRAFTNKPVGLRMIIVSAGVIMNLAFAALVFMLVFMIGMQSLPAEIGWLQPGSPAERAGLRVGDKILQVNNDTIRDQDDLRWTIVLADPDEPLHITYERTDPTTGESRIEQATLRPEMNPDQNVLQIGVTPPLSTTVAYTIPEPALPSKDQPQIGDRILAVQGDEVQDLFEVHQALAAKKGRFVDMKINRPVDPTEQDPEDFEERVVHWRASVAFDAQTGPRGQRQGHLLGLLPRVRLGLIEPDSRAEQAGLQPGDVIARWGNQVAPRIEEIQASIRNNPETDIPVEILRYVEGKPETHTLTIRPRVPGFMFRGTPMIGADLQSQENDQLVVADIVSDNATGLPTPTARLKGTMPRGATVTKVDGQEVANWTELVDRLITSAGNEVVLSWVYSGQPEATGTIYVPETLGTTFELPGARLIRAIDGRTHAEVEYDGQVQLVPVDHWRGASQVLSESVGQTVTVEFWDQYERHLDTAELAVTPEMADTWVLRVQYNVRDILTFPKTIIVQESNPVVAMTIGLRKTYYFIARIYLQMQRMIFTRSLGLEQVSGPVGIIKMGGDVAAAGLPMLLYFLALISANFAVINFLPLPILDGGLFVFLIIEKIKGQPVSLKVQVATQLIGLTLIIGFFLFITFQDIAKLAGWG